MNLKMHRRVLLTRNNRSCRFDPLPQPTTAYGYNPLCGDEITVYVQTEENRIKGHPFTGQGGTVCKAASSKTVRPKGQNIADAENIPDGIKFNLLSNEP